jgi:hypothetical protein
VDVVGQRMPFHQFDASLSAQLPQELKRTVFKGKMLPPERGGGRFLTLADRGTNHIVISTKIAADNPDPQGRPKRVGDTLRIGIERV